MVVGPSKIITYPATEYHPAGSYVDRERAVWVVTYGRSSGATLRNYFSGDKLGYASGGGYDLAGECLAQALTKVYGMPPCDGARGSSSVIAEAEHRGIAVYRMSDALYALPGLGVAR